MTALGQQMVSAVLVVAFASLYQWHGGKAALFLSIMAFLMFTGDCFSIGSDHGIFTSVGKYMQPELRQVSVYGLWSIWNSIAAFHCYGSFCVRTPL
ncbi:hypothetical protein P9222_01415 [Paenibacillus amylolyticus]|nr:hypothetical protein [Paenibacillus amylolyticus]WFR63121.1 hypothetical protein P9222_01415 [Paenibacillus amylolyticus]